MIKTYISRPLYLDKLRPYLNKDVIKDIMGQRRVGKSYILYQVMDELVRGGARRADILYINKELHEFERIRTSRDLILHVRKQTQKKKRTVLVIDEIQEIEEFEKALRDLQASGAYDIYCTGSNADLLSGELATHLSGRYVALEVYSLTYSEFLSFHKLPADDDALLKYLKYGGLPYLVNLELDDEVVYDYLKNINNTVLLKDVVSRYSVRNVAFLERLVEYLADNIGSMVSAKKISDFLKSQRTNISSNVIQNYLHFLASAFLIFKVRRSDLKGKKIFEINEKYYFEDLGLRHALVGYRQADIHKVLENAVYMHLKARGYTVTVGQLREKEIDFVCEKRGERLYVQTAYIMPDKKTRDREFGNLLEIKDNFRKVVVSMDRMIEGGYKGIEHISVADFLHNE